MFFIHIPKTAGTSFRKAAEEYYGLERICYDYAPHSGETSKIVIQEVYENKDNFSFLKKLNDNSIEFVNPRRTNGFVPPASKAIRFGISQRINLQISSIFRRREYGVKLPQGGLPMILKQSQLFSGKRVELYTSGDQFKLKIPSK